MAQQQWEAERQLRAEASKIAAHISEFLMLVYDTSADKDELHRIQMQEFAVEAEETIDAQGHLYIQEAGEEIRRHEDASGTFVNCFQSQLQNQSLESSTPNSFGEAIESEWHRLQNEESILSHEARRRQCQHQQKNVRNAGAP